MSPKETRLNRVSAPVSLECPSSAAWDRVVWLFRFLLFDLHLMDVEHTVVLVERVPGQMSFAAGGQDGSEEAGGWRPARQDLTAEATDFVGTVLCGSPEPLGVALIREEVDIHTIVGRAQLVSKAVLP